MLELADKEIKTFIITAFRMFQKLRKDMKDINIFEERWK